MARDERKHRSRRRDDRRGEDRSKDDDHDDERRHRRRKHEDTSDDSRHERKRRRDDDDDWRRRKKRHRYDDYSSEDDDRKRRRRKHDSSRHKEKKRSSRSSDEKRKHKEKKDKKDKKEKRKAIKRPDKSKMQPMGSVLGRKPGKLIDPVQDYYSYHEHFWVYLYREEGIAFNDMTSEESKEAFERFAKEYNGGNLELEYYADKLPPAVIEQSKTTKHAWSFNNVLTDREKKGLQTVQQGIRQQTEYNNKGPKLQPPPVGAAICQPTTKQEIVVEAPTFQKTREEFQEDRRANKRLRDHVRNVEEELRGGPKDFRERQLEKKRQQADRIHGAARAREDAGMELSDSALYGGDDSTNRFENALAAKKARQARRVEERSNRIQELQAKEQGRQENMLEMLGLKNIAPGQKITIAPRRDG